MWLNWKINCFKTWFNLSKPNYDILWLNWKIYCFKTWFNLVTWFTLLHLGIDACVDYKLWSRISDSTVCLQTPCDVSVYSVATLWDHYLSKVTLCRTQAASCVCFTQHSVLKYNKTVKQAVHKIVTQAAIWHHWYSEYHLNYSMY